MSKPIAIELEGDNNADWIKLANPNAAKLDREAGDVVAKKVSKANKGKVKEDQDV